MRAQERDVGNKPTGTVCSGKHCIFQAPCHRFRKRNFRFPCCKKAQGLMYKMCLREKEKQRGRERNREDRLRTGENVLPQECHLVEHPPPPSIPSSSSLHNRTSQITSPLTKHNSPPFPASPFFSTDDRIGMCAVISPVIHACMKM